MNGNRLVLGICLLAASHIAYSQDVIISEVDQIDQETVSTADYDDFNIIFHQDLESTPIGRYGLNQWREDWNNPPWGAGYDRTVIFDYNTGGRISRGMRWSFPENTFSANNNVGFLWHSPLGDTLEECYLSYSIMFKPGFNGVLSGKIPGVQGGDTSGEGIPEWDKGFGGSLIWKVNKKSDSKPPQPAFYIWHQDQLGDYGDTHKWNGYIFDVSSDIWYNITYRIVMNTATATEIGGPDGENDGIYEGFVNAKLWGQRADLRLRNLANIGVDVLRVQGFFGGGDDSWATVRDEWMLIDNVYIWTYTDTYLNNNPAVKRGRQANSLGDIIYTPFDVLFSEEPIVDPDPTEPDNQPPTVPSGLQAIDSTQNSITITWNPAADNVKVVGYKVYMNDIVFGSTGVNTYTVTPLIPATRYSFAVSAFDAVSNESPKSIAINAYTRTQDTESPTAPSNLSVDRITGYSLEVSWNASQDNVGIDKYEVYLGGVPEFTTGETFIPISRLQPNTTYRVAVRAYDTSNNWSPLSNEISATTSAPDNLPPSTPANLKETGVTEKTISLQWDPSSDNVGVREYKIYVNNVEWETSSRTDETLAQLQPGLDYDISVSAVDEAANESPKSIPIKVTTKNTDITTQPSLPTISIIQVQDKTMNPSSTSEMTSLGYTELKNFGLEISEKDNPGKESLILHGIESAEVVNKDRVEEGLQVLYNFAEGEGNIVEDLSKLEPSLDLKISKEGLATEWLPGQGLKINENTIITQQGNSTRLFDALSATNEITLEAWVKQEEIEQSGPARIITLSTDNSSRAATIAHEGNMVFYNYISRLQTSETDGNGNPALETEQDFTSTSLHHVVYTRNSQGNENIYVNGMKLASGNREGDFSTWGSDNRLALVNEHSGERPWKGVIYLAAIYNRALSKEEVNDNYDTGFGQVRFTTELNILESNVDYRLTPFAIIDQGLVYGEAKDFIYQNVAQTDSLLSIYPNPNSGNITITIKNRDENVKEGYLRLADFAGQIHFTREIDLSEGLLEKVFELQLPTSLNNGLYSLILIAGSRSVAEKLVLIR